jgi:hypothetical protein
MEPFFHLSRTVDVVVVAAVVVVVDAPMMLLPLPLDLSRLVLHIKVNNQGKLIKFKDSLRNKG